MMNAGNQVPVQSVIGQQDGTQQTHQQAQFGTQQPMVGGQMQTTQQVNHIQNPQMNQQQMQQNQMQMPTNPQMGQPQTQQMMNQQQMQANQQMGQPQMSGQMNQMQPGQLNKCCIII